jgi:hypothetical protein
VAGALGALGALAALAATVIAVAAGGLTAGPRGDGTGVTPNGWIVDPAGTQVQVGGRPYGLALSPDGKRLLLSNDGQGTQSVMAVDSAAKPVAQTIPYSSPQALYLGVVYAPDGKRAYAIRSSFARSPSSVRRPPVPAREMVCVDVEKPGYPKRPVT